MARPRVLRGQPERRFVASAYFAITSRRSAISKSTGDHYRVTQSAAAFLDRGGAPSWMGSVVEYLAAPEMLALFLGDPAAFVRNGGSDWVGKQCAGSSDLGEVCAGDGPVQGSHCNQNRI